MPRTLSEINAIIAEMEKEKREILKKIEEAEREKVIIAAEMKKAAMLSRELRNRF